MVGRSEALVDILLYAEQRGDVAPLVVPPQGATTECALALFWYIFACGCPPPYITVGFSLPGSRGYAGTTKPPRQDLTPSLDCHVGDGHGGE